MRSVVLALFLALCDAAPGLCGEPVRDPWAWPFTPGSEWNTPLGSGAAFAPASDLATRDILAGPAIIHAGHWSHPLFLAASGDPVETVTDRENERSFTFRIPLDAKPDPEWDHHMYVVDPTKLTVLEMFHAVRQASGGFVADRAFLVNLRTSGMHMSDGRYPGIRAMDASGMGGLIRVWELQAHLIPHALTFLLPPWRLKHGPVWPSAREDYWGFRDYLGHVPIGSLIAIPPSVDVAALGLTPSGLALARALQDYGAYCDDSSGSEGLIISAEGATETMPQMADLRSDFFTIRAELRLVTNNTALTPGGGGTPRRPPAPPLMPAE
jgi:hypothetical protein